MSAKEWIRPGGMRWGGHLHEPIYFYRGEGRPVGCVDGGKPWIGQWYDYVRSDAVFAELAQLGVNTLYLSFFKGYGRTFETPEMVRSAGLVRRAKELGIRSVLYIQPTNFFPEFVAEVPAAADWICRDAAGRESLYGNKQHRTFACLSASGWVDYVARMAAGATSAGADGILLDNINHNQCCCRRCQDLFAEQTGRPGPLIVEAPGDPEVIAWRCRRSEAVITRIVNEARRVNPEIVLFGNPAFPRGMDVMRSGVDPQAMARLFDVFLLENKAFPRCEEGRLIHSSYGYHLLSATGHLAAPSVWLPPVRLPESPRQVMMQSVEPVIFGGHALCCPWVLRPVDDARATPSLPAWHPYFRWDGLKDAWRQSLQFSADAAPILREGKPWARLAVLHRSRWFARDWSSALQRLLTIDAALLAAWLPYRFVFEEDEISREDADLLLLPFGDEDGERPVARRFADSGGTVLAWPDADGELFADPSVVPGEAAREFANYLRRTYPAISLFEPVDPAPSGVLSFVTSQPGGHALWLLNLGQAPVSFRLQIREPARHVLSGVLGCPHPPHVAITTGQDRLSAAVVVDRLDVAACLLFTTS